MHYKHNFVTVSTAVRNRVLIALPKTRNIGKETKKKIKSEIKKRCVIKKRTKSAAKKNTAQVRVKIKIATALTSINLIGRNTVVLAQVRTKIRRDIVQKRKINIRKRRNLEIKTRRKILKLKKK